MPDSNTRAERENDSESYSAMRHREAEEARKGHEEWERVYFGLLDNESDEFKGRLNDRLIEETDWGADIENVLGGGASIMTIFNYGFLGDFYRDAIMSHARTLASIMVGADHE